MMINSTNVASIYTDNRMAPAGNTTEPNNNQGRTEAGRTSGVGDAVSVSISAAALETNRAVKASDQTADQNQISNSPRGENQAQNPSPNEKEGSEALSNSRKSSIDVVV